MDSYIFFGASTLGKIAFYHFKDKLNILFFCDNDKSKWGKKHCGVQIISPIMLKEVVNKNKDIKIVITSNFYNEIYYQLKEIKHDKIYIFNFKTNLIEGHLIENQGISKIRSHQSKLYLTEYGVKTTNQLLSSENFRFYRGEKLELPIEQLKLGIDGLKDAYTLFDKNVQMSPHLKLMEHLNKKDDFTNSEYFQRLQLGTLDLRSPQVITNNFVTYTQKKFKERLSEFKIGKIPPIRVGKVGNDWYIIDGKHRAALSYMLGNHSIVAFDNTEIFYDSFNSWIYNFMMMHKGLFRKNITFFERIFNN